MRIPHQQPDESFPINVTNMIDVFLLLLIFFLVATTFTREERDATVKLPGAAAPQALSSAVRELVLNIREDGSVTVGGKAVAQADLPAMLQQAATEDGTRKVLIRADAQAYVKYFAAVALACRNAGFDEARIGYIPEDSNTSDTGTGKMGAR